ncbi:FtsW/RodA/SpoVE family cell cycle protein [Amphiplicatus metriothermophilus]|uniref:Probable peptidoglycan glycosyltransferase FtsW n=1 Tax=Amphiplicatus metriothermophilus TaxID=1519374 RepID=A0A239PSQ1_9PROT|nr:putative peptidoglycan glycosyltransferase FtsW [Amphiplicatus metriothermophilus]MBB5519252.1 cell division protein FtsW [Amphiplicatus metriothermophilus]SNT73321.1 cell division protein FtsW [Amphiplicatus metriothermophilus]
MRALSSSNHSPAALWWRSVDQVGLLLVGLIASIGVALLFAAGPAAAARLGIASSFHFPLRQLVFLVPAFALMIGVSMLTPLQARRLGVVLFLAAAALMLAALLFAPEINGAKRWIALGSFSLQPSELAKPGFVVAASWMLAEGARNPRFPGAAITAGLYALLMALLILQPDYGQAALVTALWLVMLFVVFGWSWWMIAVGLAGAGSIAGGYFFSPHIARRIEAFLDPAAGETYQVDKALQAIAHGGWFGRGSQGASVKYQLPDAHTDFIYAVAGEEYGFILCAGILALFGALVVRFYARAASLSSLFAQSAVCGLAAMIGLQSFINIAVNLRALPAKGMTLPFISYGGSSLLATGLAFGLIFALSRRHGPAARRKEIMP